jgi:2,4-dienoyl-CoA reductase-like NADH-dependent reductase (Old Yellow Enzyme family)
MRSLFESVQLGSLTLANRVFMAPLTRNRANAEGVPSDLAATYYAQRASAGLGDVLPWSRITHSGGAALSQSAGITWGRLGQDKQRASGLK